MKRKAAWWEGKGAFEKVAEVGVKVFEYNEDLYYKNTIYTIITHQEQTDTLKHVSYIIGLDDYFRNNMLIDSGEYDRLLQPYIGQLHYGNE
jgi:hypothetical protein